MEYVASTLGCVPDSLHFVHLGVSVGQNMARVSARGVHRVKFSGFG